MKDKAQRPITGVCPYCKTSVKTLKGEDVKCENCGASLTYAELKNQSAVIQTTENGKKKFNLKNLFKKWWFWVAVVAIIALIVGIAIPTSPGNVDTLYEKNQTITVDNISIRVNSVSSTNTIPALGSYSYNTTNSYLVVLIKLTNNKTYSFTPTSNDFKVYYNGHSYSYLPTESYYYGENDGTYKGLYAQTIGAGLSDTVYLVFEVPASHTTANYVLSFKPIATEVKIKLY